MTDQPNKQDVFFIGWAPVPASLRLFLSAVAGFLIGGFTALGLAIGASQDDPGPGAFRWDWGAQSLTGVVTLAPYPVLHVSNGSDRVAAGRAVLLSGIGKTGVRARLAPFDGKAVTLRGIMLKRGDLHGMQLGGGKDDVREGEAGGALPAAKSLGRWKVNGEICDGKCLAGAMRPGRGISHRACANLCLIGGAPPVFVAEPSVAGQSYLLLAGADGGPLPPAYLAHVGKLVSLEGEIEARGVLHVFKVDLQTVAVLP